MTTDANDRYLSDRLHTQCRRASYKEIKDDDDDNNHDKLKEACTKECKDPGRQCFCDS